MGRSAPALLPQLCSGVGAAVTMPGCLQPPGDEDEDEAAAASRNEGDDKRGGINPLRAQGEIMREI